MSKYITYPVMLTLESGTRLDAEVTMPNKPYWAGQLESDIMRRYNHSLTRLPGAERCVRVKVFRNSHPGGYLVDSVRRRVIKV